MAGATVAGGWHGVIGWRPYLFTALALALVAVVVLDVHRNVEPPSPCAAAKALERSGFAADALAAYESVLKTQPSASCVPAGVAVAVRAECREAQALAAVDPTQARAALVTALSDQPGLTAAACAPAAVGGGTTTSSG